MKRPWIPKKPSKTTVKCSRCNGSGTATYLKEGHVAGCYEKYYVDLKCKDCGGKGFK